MARCKKTARANLGPPPFQLPKDGWPLRPGPTSHRRGQRRCAPALGSEILASLNRACFANSRARRRTETVLTCRALGFHRDASVHSGPLPRGQKPRGCREAVLLRRRKSCVCARTSPASRLLERIKAGRFSDTMAGRRESVGGVPLPKRHRRLKHDYGDD